MKLTTSRRTYRLHGLTPILGSQPADRFIHTHYIAVKAPTPGMSAEETGMIPEANEDQGVTVFHRNPDDDALCMLDYQITGFFKEAANSVEADTGLKASRSKVDKYLFIEPRHIPIMRDEKRIFDEDGVLERPHRAINSKGIFTTLKSSEMICDPWSIDFTVVLVRNVSTPRKPTALTWDAIETALEYGKFHGLGQWRNGGYGRFTWECLDTDGGEDSNENPT